jgi:hypothetical protein
MVGTEGAGDAQIRSWRRRGESEGAPYLGMNTINMGFDFIEVLSDTVYTNMKWRGDEEGLFAALDASSHDSSLSVCLFFKCIAPII